MPLAFVFWFLYILWVVLTLVLGGIAWPSTAMFLLEAAVVGVLGWGVFGKMVKG